MHELTPALKVWRMPHLHSAILNQLPHKDRITTLCVDKASFLQGIGILWKHTSEDHWHTVRDSVSRVT
jgi:hypothetical protein